MILILAALAYLQARPNSVPSGTTTNPCSCPYEPPTNLLQVSQPFTDVQVGISVPFSIELPYLTPTSFDYDFGDGTSFSTNSSTANHTYAGPGNYLVSVTAILSPGNFANVMTNNRSLVPVRALPLGSSSELAGLPVLEGTITSNSTTGTDPSVVIHAGDSVTLAAQYPITGPIPGYSVGPPTFLLAPNLTATTNVGQNSSTSTIVFPDPGIFVIVATGKITPSSAPSVDENYTWTVFVAPKDESASVVGQGTPVGAHPPLNLTAYELAPGGFALRGSGHRLRDGRSGTDRERLPDAHHVQWHRSRPAPSGFRTRPRHVRPGQRAVRSPMGGSAGKPGPRELHLCPSVLRAVLRPGNEGLVARLSVRRDVLSGP